MGSVGAAYLSPSYPFKNLSLRLHLYSCSEQKCICEANSLTTPPEHALIPVTKQGWCSSISLLSVRLLEAKKVCSREFPLTSQFQSTAVPVFENNSLGFGFVSCWWFFLGGGVGGWGVLFVAFFIDHFMNALCLNESPRLALSATLLNIKWLLL